MFRSVWRKIGTSSGTYVRSRASGPPLSVSRPRDRWASVTVTAVPMIVGTMRMAREKAKAAWNGTRNRMRPRTISSVLVVLRNTRPETIMLTILTAAPIP
ncbi:MAG: hypothetical protein H6Q85_2897 [candidate division NC10 bacterium]|nr:hypothetical protein [candidate division NC10 bacterium]